MNRRWLTGLALAACALAAQADGSARAYAARAAIELSSDDGLQRLELPLQVLQASRSPGLADLRLVDAQGESVPFAWTPQPPRGIEKRRLEVPRFAWPRIDAANGGRADELKVEVNAAGAVVRIGGPKMVSPSAVPSLWLLDLSALTAVSGLPRGIELDWPRREAGLSTGVRLEASDDAQRWSPLGQAQLLEVAGGPSLRRIDWPAGASLPRYLRLAFDQPLALAGALLVLGHEQAEPRLRSAPVRFLHVAGDGGQPAGALLDLQGRIPLRGLQLELPEVNSVLGLQLDQRDDPAQPWRAAGSLVAWRLLRDGREAQSGRVAIDAPPARYWRLRADRGTPLPGSDLPARIEWQAPELVFVARGGAGLQLLVGREKDISQASALSTLMSGYQPGAEQRLPAARLGPLQPRTPGPIGWRDRLAEAGREDMQRWLLWLVLGVAVAGLALLSWRLARDIRR